MVRPQETTAFSTTFDHHEEAAPATGCGYFRHFCLGRNDDEESHSNLLRERERSGSHKEIWILKPLKKLKQFSEVVAGPKWKNFIRRIGRFCNSRKATMQFNYSPETYALNFAGDDQQENDGNVGHSFSTRYAPGFSAGDQQRNRNYN